MNEVSMRAINLPVLATCLGHRVGRNLEVIVARFVVEAKAVHGVERPPQWALCIVPEPAVHAGLGFRIVLKVEVQRLVLSREEPRR
jgi:hypothetical protein